MAELIAIENLCRLVLQQQQEQQQQQQQEEEENQRGELFI